MNTNIGWPVFILAGTVMLGAVSPSSAQDSPARQILLEAAEAMGGVDRLRALDNIVMTGFGQNLNQQGGGNPSPDPRAPSKWQAVHALERTFDLRNFRSQSLDRRNFMFPFAMEFGNSWNLNEQTRSGVAALDHPLPAVLQALSANAQLGSVSVEDERSVVAVTIDSGQDFWIGIDAISKLPAWVRWIAPSTTLGDVTYTAYFTGYLPFDEVQLPVGISTAIDWRNTTTSILHVDGYTLNADVALPPQQAARAPSVASAVEVAVMKVADGVWDVRAGGNAGAVIEFADHLVMFEAYGNEAATFARLDAANALVRGKQVTKVIVSHHHFDHSGGLRAAVSRGLSIISRRGNEGIFREMVARPAPNFPDALARNPQPLEFVAVDEHLVLEDATQRVDLYHAVGHLHMAEALIAYVPEQRVFLEGDFTTFDWEFNWWGGAYMDTVDRYELDPAINIPVHGQVTSFAEAIASIEAQVERARAFCNRSMASGNYPAGCPIQYSRD